MSNTSTKGVNRRIMLELNRACMTELTEHIKGLGGYPYDVKDVFLKALERLTPELKTRVLQMMADNDPRSGERKAILGDGKPGWYNVAPEDFINMYGLVLYCLAVSNSSDSESKAVVPKLNLF